LFGAFVQEINPFVQDAADPDSLNVTHVLYVQGMDHAPQWVPIRVSLNP
jgi:hypothetical protein